MDSFKANTAVLTNEGKKIIDSSISFRDNADKIMSDIDLMLEKAYISDGSRAVAEHIKGYKEDLYTMATIMNQYGNFCVNMGSTVSLNESNMVDMYKVNE